MDMIPLISIVIPYYNVENRLFFSCLESVINQKYHNIEILIINDGSDKKYTDILADSAKHDSRIKIINKKNEGASTARNTGILEARGEYIAFVDADDVINNDYLFQALQMIQSTNADFIIGATQVLEPEDREGMKQLPTTEEKSSVYKIYNKHEIESLRPKLIASNQIIRFDNGGYINRGPVARLLKTEIARKVLFPTGIAIGEDVIWNQSVLKECDQIVIAENVWYYYFQNSKSSSHRYRENAIDIIREEGMVLYHTLDISKDQLYRAYCNKILSETRLIICRAYLTRKENKESFIKKWSEFNKLKRVEPWKLITRRYVRIGDRKEKLTYYLFRLNLYFPVAYLKDRLMK